MPVGPAGWGELDQLVCLGLTVVSPAFVVEGKLSAAGAVIVGDDLVDPVPRVVTESPVTDRGLAAFPGRLTVGRVDLSEPYMVRPLVPDLTSGATVEAGVRFCRLEGR